MTKLTKRQQEILALIESHIATSGSPPTRAEIAKTMGFRSPNAAEDHLRALARKGVIELVPGTSRGIRLVRSSTAIPIVAMERIHPNQPIFSENHLKGSCQVLDRSFFAPAADYFLQYSHKGIPELAIQEGDYLAIHQTHEAEAGQIVLTKQNHEIHIRRLPLDSHHHFAIEGVVVGVIRSFNTTTRLS